MQKGSLSELIWKMECKGYDSNEIHIWISCIWMLTNIYFIPSIFRGYWQKKDYDDRLAQAHIEIDFTGYKKSNYVLAV